MTVLPPSWVTVKLAKLATYIQRGKSPKYVVRSALPVINQRCVRWHGIDEQHLKYVDPAQWEDWGDERFLRVGDILWNSTGTGTIGRAALFRGLHSSDRAVADSHVTIIRPNEAVLGEYLHRYIESPAVQSKIDQMQSGSTNQVELSKNEVLDQEIPLPPLNEQHRIIAKIRALSTHTDHARDQLAHIPRLIESYKHATLVGGIRGDLTRKWRGRQGGSDSWRPVRIAELVDWASGKNLPAKRQCPGTVPVIGGNGVSGSHNEPLISHPTIVVGRVGAQCGNVHFSTGPAWITDNAIYAKAISGLLDVRFTVALLRSKNLNTLSGGTGQPYVSQNILNDVEFELPPLKEQVEIVRRVEDRFAWIDGLATEANHARGLLDHLHKAVLAKAFRGELVPQHPDDESAIDLLERIQKDPRATRTSPRRPSKLKHRQVAVPSV